MKKFLKSIVCASLIFAFGSSVSAAPKNPVTALPVPGSISPGAPAGKTPITKKTDENGNEVYTQRIEVPVRVGTTGSKSSQVEPEAYSNGFTKIYVNFNYISRGTGASRTFEFSYNIDSSALINPPVNAEFILQRSDYEYGFYNDIQKMPKVWNASYITDYKMEPIGANTGYYRARVNLTPAKLDVFFDSPTIYSNAFLINRTGNVWVIPYLQDPKSGAVVNKPPANWPKVQLYPRPSNLNKTYQDWYNRTFNANIVCEAGVLDVHHIRPLHLGGDNSMSNLIHLDPIFHKSLSSWFAGY